MPKRKTVANKAKMTKAQFVRSQPAGMSAKEVIAKAKAQGIMLTEDAVYKTRSLDKKRATKKGAKAGKIAPTVRAKGRTPDKKQRVLDLVAQNPSWGAEEIAKAAGASASYVYSVWRGKRSGRASTTAPSTTNGATIEFYRAVKKVGGVGKAKELLANIEAYESA